jgi:hypothetical protein
VLPLVRRGHYLRRRRLLPLLIAASAAVGGHPAGAAQAAAPLLSFEGYDRVRFGMSVAQAEAATGATARARGADHACYVVQFHAYRGVRFMVENGRITRADVAATVGNVVGVRTGMTLAEVRKRWPQARVWPHKYDPDGHYIAFASRDGGSEIVAEETGHKVSAVRAGLLPAVEYVEGCL